MPTDIQQAVMNRPASMPSVNHTQDNYRRHKKLVGGISQAMGNSTTSSVLHEEEEPPLRINDHGFDIRSIINENGHKKERFSQPVLAFDSWKILHDDLNSKGDKSNIDELLSNGDTNKNSGSLSSQSDTDVSSSYEELSTIPSVAGGNKPRVIRESLSMPRQSNHCPNIHLDVGHERNQTLYSGDIANVRSTKPSFVKKPRPNSLAIVSRSHDHINTLSSEAVNFNHSANEEVNRLVLPSSSRGDDTSASCLSNANRSASADTLRTARSTTGLQQRRNCRPTSLHIPNLVQVPQPSQTAEAFVNPQQLPFNRQNAAIIRQRSYSMPSSAFADLTNTPKIAKKCQPTTLDEAVTLISKKKLTKTEIDEQSLLHRAADAGHVKLTKKCIGAGCSVLKRLVSLNGTSALHCAARADKNSAQITRLLLETGIDVDTKNDLGETAIFSAIIHRNMDTVDLLVQHGCNINSIWQESTPIYLILCNRNIESAIQMLKQGAEITNLEGPSRQPLHAVLDMCHSNQLISHQTMQLLKLIIQSDGHVIKHLQTYEPRVASPGCSGQELIYHIYRMEKGPSQDEGKALIRHLIRLGYMPSRGELSTMSQSDQDYEDLYSYIKNGPNPLKDLCVRKIRQSIPINVTRGMERGGDLSDKARTQILLEPLPQLEHEYENVTVLRRHKSARKSKRKSLKDIMSGIGRLSRRFSKKTKTDEMNNMQLSLPHQRLSSRMSGSLPAGINRESCIDENQGIADPSTSLKRNPSPKVPPAKPELKPKPELRPKPNLKPKYTKRDQTRKSDVTVADIVKRYSNGDINDGSGLIEQLGTADVTSEKVEVHNPAYESGPESPPARLGACITIDNVDEPGQSDPVAADDDQVIVKFRDSAYSSGRSENYTGGKLTPMKDHAPEIGSSAAGLSYSLPANSASIRIDSEDAML